MNTAPTTFQVAVRKVLVVLDEPLVRTREKYPNSRMVGRRVEVTRSFQNGTPDWKFELVWPDTQVVSKRPSTAGTWQSAGGFGGNADLDPVLDLTPELWKALESAV